MSNPLKKTMVFLGLAEDDLQAQEEETSRPGKVAAASVPADEQPTGVVAAAPQRQSAQRAAVTPLRKVTPTRQSVAPSMSEILTVHPTKYSDAAVIAESFREGIPVVINLSQMADTDAKRLVDFASGLSMGLRGRIERVTSKVFLLSPEHIAVSGDEQRANDSGSFFVAPSA
ncbi:cell division protein SepF [Leucobacter sp. GX24907]